MKQINSIALKILLASAMTQLALASAPDKGPVIISLSNGTGSVQFEAIGRPSALHINGKGEAPEGEFSILNNNLSGTASFKLESLDTGIKMRNEHMKKKYLETDKYPKALFTFTKLEIPESIRIKNGSAENVPFAGKLKLHGIEKAIAGTAKLERKDEHLVFGGDFSLKIGEYQIASPGFAGITMADDVKVNVRFSAPLVTRQ